MSAAQALLARIVDFAGLFPPATLDMETAVRSYQQYLAGEDAWMLGSFLVPATRLTEFAETFNRVCCGEQEAPWTLGVVCAGQADGDARAIATFQQGAIFLSSLEAKASDAAEADASLQRLPTLQGRYLEFPPEKTGEILPVLARHRVRAKLRAGGLTPAAVPAIAAVTAFLRDCAGQRIAFKATAGLHHALRGERALVPASGSEHALMHGFVNLFLAAALAWFGAETPAIERTLEEENPTAFQFDDDLLRWHHHTLIADQIEQVRRDFAIGFGSCSFAEPVDDLKALGWL